MEAHLTIRPLKRYFTAGVQSEIRDKAVIKVRATFLPNSQIEKILVIGSSVKGTFGQYEEPGFRGSLFSDFDFIFIVSDDYQIPTWLDIEPDGKPFPDENLNLAYRNKKFIDDKFDCEFFFIRKSSLKIPNFNELAEKAGIPITENSSIKHLVIYQN
jgi:hypothetical protein